MDSNRLQKVARLIQKDMGLIFQSEARNLFNGAMITPTRVRDTDQNNFHIQNTKCFLKFAARKGNIKTQVI